MIPHLKEFLERYPKIATEYRDLPRHARPGKGKCGSGDRIDPQAFLELCSMHLITPDGSFVPPPDYFKNMGHRKNRSNPTSDHHPYRSATQQLMEFKTGRMIRFEPYIYFNDTRAIRRAALHGLGIAQARKCHHIVAEDIKANRLVESEDTY